MLAFRLLSMLPPLAVCVPETAPRTDLSARPVQGVHDREMAALKRCPAGQPHPVRGTGE